MNINIEDFIFDGKLPLDNRLFFMQHLAPYAFFAPRCKDKDILDIGVGEGYGTYFLSNFAKSVTGLDSEVSCAGRLENYIRRFKKNNIKFVYADAVSLPFSDKLFDRVVTCQVIEHIPEDRLVQFLTQIKRVLKDDGILFVSTLNLKHNVKKAATYEKFIEHHKEFNREDLEPLLKSVFPRVEMYGLNITLRHRFFLRLKRWGFLKYSFFGANPVVKFFNHISLRDFKVSPHISRQSSDLLAVCFKT